MGPTIYKVLHIITSKIFKKEKLNYCKLKKSMRKSLFYWQSSIVPDFAERHLNLGLDDY